MAEGVVAQIKSAPGDIKRMPWAALTIGAIFLFLVLLLEAFKPGLVTGPFKALLRMVGVKGAV